MTRRPSRRRLRSQRGFSLLEVLIAFALVGFWTLGSARMMSATAQLEKTAEFRSSAVILASDLLERIQANQGSAATGAYVRTNFVNGTVASCSAGACTGAQLAEFDLSEWQSKVAARLPSATFAVTSPLAGNPFTYTVTINWSDRRSGQTYASGGTSEPFAYTASRTYFTQ